MLKRRQTNDRPDTEMAIEDKAPEDSGVFDRADFNTLFSRKRMKVKRPEKNEETNTDSNKKSLFNPFEKPTLTNSIPSDLSSNQLISLPGPSSAFGQRRSKRSRISNFSTGSLSNPEGSNNFEPFEAKTTNPIFDTPGISNTKEAQISDVFQTLTSNGGLAFKRGSYVKKRACFKRN